MTWSYDTALTAAKDKVRFLVGDTDTADQQLQNEEITFVLAEEGTTNVYGAAAAAARGIAAKYARLSQKSVGDLSISYQQRQDHYDRLAERLERKLAERAVPYFGATKKADKTTVAGVSDNVVSTPDFKRGMHDNPATAGDATKE